VQEALLGMTALFRGEYDPIEKFGVAMKQSEINAELVARKLDHLTGSELRNAEQVIRMELLYERAADAMGAFSGQSGNLFVEQKKLQAQFENMQAEIGQGLLPVMGSLVEALVPLVDELTPRLTQMVQDSIPALESFTGLIADMSDESTTTGKTVDALASAFGRLFDFVASNFGTLVQITLLIGGVTSAVQLLTTALTFLNNHPVIFSVTTLATAFIIGTDKANQYREAIKSIWPELNALQTESLALGGGFAFLSPIFNGFKSIATMILQATGTLDRFNKLLAQSAEYQINLRAHLAMDRRHSGLPGVPRVENLNLGGNIGVGGGGSSARQRAQQAAEEAARKEQELLDKRQKAFESFNDAVKNLFGQIKDSIMDSFTLPDLGNSVNSITKNIGKLLERTKAFAKNIKTLSEQGLDATLLQQVIGAGPVQGAKLAQALVGGGSGFLQELNSAFGEFGNIAGGIAGIATERAFANQGTVNNYSIEVTGGIATSSDVGRAVVNAIKDFERQSGTAWRG
jgi:hypothetical protein